jgi:hypothetical protein
MDELNNIELVNVPAMVENVCELRDAVHIGLKDGVHIGLETHEAEPIIGAEFVD